MTAALVNLDLPLLETMAAAGATVEMIMSILRARQAAADAEAEVKREKDRRRKRKERGVSAGNAGNGVTSRDIADKPQPVAQIEKAEPPAVVSSSPEKNTSSLSYLPSSRDLFEEEREVDTRARCNLGADFDEWYAGYPHKVAKAAARRAYFRARRNGVSQEILIAGRDRYRETKPLEIAWCNPATWLNGERWLDQPAQQFQIGGSNEVARNSGKPGGFVRGRLALVHTG